jgi:hypothetical protein
VARAATLKVVSYWEIMTHQPLWVIVGPFAFDAFGGLHKTAVEFLFRSQGIVGQAQVSHEGSVWFSSIWGMCFSVARWVGSLLGGCLAG